MKNNSQLKKIILCMSLTAVLLMTACTKNEVETSKDTRETMAKEATQEKEIESEKSNDKDEESHPAVEEEQQKERIVFKDKVFEQVVLESLGVDKEDLTKEILEKQTELHFKKKDIQSLEDLKYFPNLKLLNIEGGTIHIDDLSPLGNLTQLEELWISGDIKKLGISEDMDYLECIEIEDDWQVLGY